MNPADVTYRAVILPNPEADGAWNDEDAARHGIRCLIQRDIYAGICGPFGEFEVTGDLSAVEAELRRLGYEPGPWTFRLAYDGLHIESILARS
jgi:hypothetical protein